MFPEHKHDYPRPKFENQSDSHCETIFRQVVGRFLPSRLYILVVLSLLHLLTWQHWMWMAIKRRHILSKAKRDARLISHTIYCFIYSITNRKKIFYTRKSTLFRGMCLFPPYRFSSSRSASLLSPSYKTWIIHWFAFKNLTSTLQVGIKTYCLPLNLWLYNFQWQKTLP